MQSNTAIMMPWLAAVFALILSCGGCASSGNPKQAPPGAIILFNGHSTAGWKHLDSDDAIQWPVLEDALEINQPTGDIVTRQRFRDVTLHLEWMAPPGSTGQLAGNSGVKLMECYEIQILNGSTDPLPTATSAGAIYGHQAAAVNATSGPGTWQTYDIDFTAPRWVGTTKTANARITVWWNDVLIHDDVEIPTQTGASRGETPDLGSVLLQAHRSEADGDVRFRNIWIVPQ